MLSERGLAIIEKLIENNRKPITARALAISLGVSERSVKTYIKEVSDFCDKKGLVLNRKPGIGFEADFTDGQIGDLKNLVDNRAISMSRQQRINYIAYILLSGWDTYTVALFSEELSVSKNVINEDIKLLESELEAFKISVNKTAGHGISISGDEFSIRKALRHMCRFPVENKELEAFYDHRISREESSLWANNFSRKNYGDAVDIIHFIEEKYRILYTDYSVQMLAEYMTIQLYRIKNGHVLDNLVKAQQNMAANEYVRLKRYDEIDEKKENHVDVHEQFVDMHTQDAVYDIRKNISTDIIAQISRLTESKLPQGESDYIRILLQSATLQEGESDHQADAEAVTFANELLQYLSQIMGMKLVENELLKTSIESFVPSSLTRTRYGIEVTNPFLQDITEMYSGIFATCFTLSRIYEKYTGNMPSDHEIAFIALLVGGALHRTPQSIRAILIGTAGIAAANIVAAKIENRIPNIDIVAILSSEKINRLNEYEYDIVLSMIPGQVEDDRIIQISPIVSSKDEKLIRDKCAELRSDYGTDKNEFGKLIGADNIIFIEKKKSKKELLKEACGRLIDGGYVTKEFLKDVLERENVESTAIGSGIAIPHGKAENVVNPQICVVKLPEPLNWGNTKVDVIFLLALNFENMTTTKAFFRDFTRVLSEEDSLGAIRETHGSKELEGVLKAKLHWI